MAGSILLLGVARCQHEKQLWFVEADALRETKLAVAGSMAAAACLRNLPSSTALCSAMHKANYPRASEEERQRTATGKLWSHRNKEMRFSIICGVRPCGHMMRIRIKLIFLSALTKSYKNSICSQQHSYKIQHLACLNKYNITPRDHIFFNKWTEKRGLVLLK